MPGTGMASHTHKTRVIFFTPLETARCCPTDSAAESVPVEDGTDKWSGYVFRRGTRRRAVRVPRPHLSVRLCNASKLIIFWE